jgi:hypothetical protein
MLASIALGDEANVRPVAQSAGEKRRPDGNLRFQICARPVADLDPDGGAVGCQELGVVRCGTANQHAATLGPAE